MMNVLFYSVENHMSLSSELEKMVQKLPVNYTLYDPTEAIEDLASVCTHAVYFPEIFSNKSKLVDTVWREIVGLANIWNETNENQISTSNEKNIHLIFAEKIIKISEPAVEFNSLNKFDSVVKINFDIKKEAIVFLKSTGKMALDVVMKELTRSDKIRYRRVACQLFGDILKRYPNIENISPVREMINRLNKDRDIFIRTYLKKN